MKNIFFFVSFTLASVFSDGQTSNAKPGSAIPPFKMLQSSGKYYSNEDVQKNKPFVLIYFAPDCDHCIKMMDELFKKIHQLDNATVMMVSFKPVNDLVWFEKKYHTSKYGNIKVGTEGTTYILRNYYRLDRTPFTAVYDRKGRLAFSYSDETPVNEMLARYRKI